MRDICCFCVYVSLLLVCSVALVSSDGIQEERVCADPECLEPISHARALLSYSSAHRGVLSFKKGALMTILSKTTDSDVKQKRGYWGAEINGKRGYVPPNLVEEFKVLRRDVKYVVPTEVGLKKLKAKPKINDIEPSQGEVLPNVSPVTGGVAAEFGDGGPPNTPYTVVEGTTMYLGTDGERLIEPSTTQEVPLKTDSVVGKDVTGEADKMASNEDSLKHNELKDSAQSEELQGEDDDEEDSEDDGDEEGEEGDEEDDEASNESVDAMEEVQKQIDEALQNSPGLSPEKDAAFLDRVKIKEIEPIPQPSDEPKMTISSPSSSESDAETPSPPAGMPSSPLDVLSPPTDGPTPLPEVDTSSPPTEKPSLPSDESSPGWDPLSLPSETPLPPPDTPLSHLDLSSAASDTYSDQASELSRGEIETNSSFNDSLSPPVSQPPLAVEDAISNVASSEEINLETLSSLEETKATETSTPQAPSSPLPVSEEEHSTQPPKVSSDTTINQPREESESQEAPMRPPNLGILPPIYPGLFPSQPLLHPDKVAINSDSFEESINSSPHVPDDSLIKYNVEENSQENGSNLIPSSTEELPLGPQENLNEVNQFETVTQDASTTTPQDQHAEARIEVPLVQKFDSHSIDNTKLPSSNTPEYTSSGTLESMPIVVPSDTPSLVGLETESSVVPETPSSVSLETSAVVSEQFSNSDTSSNEAGSDSDGLFSKVSGMFSGIFGSQPVEDSTVSDEPISVSSTFGKVDSPPSENIMEGVPPTVEIVPEGECKSVKDLETDCDDAPSPSMHLFEFFENKTPGSAYTFLYLVITAVTVLIFTLGHYFIERNRQDGPLIAKVNQLTRELQVATAQLESRAFKESGSLAEVNNEVLAALQAEIDELRRIKSEQEALLESQQQELDSATEAGLELNRMLSDLLAQKQGPDSLLVSVEHLQGQLDTQQRVIDDMNRSLAEKSEENEALQEELTSTSEKYEALEEELSDLKQNLNIHLKEKEEVTLELEDRIAKLQLELLTTSKSRASEVAALKKSLDDATEKLSVRDSEFKVLSDAIEQLKVRGGVDTAALYDVGLAKAELVRMQTERDALRERLSDEEGARRLLEDHVKAVDAEVEVLRASCDAAEKDKLEAETRLAVLSNYFKEKETQLQKELGLQEAMWVQKQGDETSVFERIKSLQEEVDSYNFDSFPTSNDGLSNPTSLSSTTYEPSSSPSLKASNVTPKKCSSLKSFSKAPSSKSKRLSRRKSSADFEARLEKVQQMTSLKLERSSPGPVPEDLMLLKELKTVRASPFREAASTPEPESDGNSAKQITFGSASKLSEMVNKFEKLQNTPKLNGILNDFSYFKAPEIRQWPPKCDNRVEESINGDMTVDTMSLFSISSEELGCKEKNLSEPDETVSYNLGPPVLPEKSDEFLNLPLIPIPAPRKSWESDISILSPRTSITSDKPESEDCHSIPKDCEMESSATVEFDIKVVANATSNVTKVKKKMNAKPKQGSQNEMLKKEILDQERGLKGQIATLEKKAHENWVAARQAERRLEESKQEAGQLRNMLTLMEKSQVSETDGKPPGRLPSELNGDEPLLPILGDGTSPLPFPPALPLDPLAPPPMLPPGFMPPPFMHPPPSGFIPPPPFLPGDRRPAPLGRMSSPPLNSRFSPSPGDYDEYDRMSPAPLSPPVRNFRSPPVENDRFKLRNPPEWFDGPPRGGGFRPVASQRDSRRDYQGSNLSSGHSSNDSLDKSRSKV